MIMAQHDQAHFRKERIAGDPRGGPEGERSAGALGHARRQGAARGSPSAARNQAELVKRANEAAGELKQANEALLKKVLVADEPDESSTWALQNRAQLGECEQQGRPHHLGRSVVQVVLLKFVEHVADCFRHLERPPIVDIAPGSNVFRT